ncbi:phosphodiester glycosidase family protein [Cohnella lubricantis]|uniref:Phosphodiester glycosidase family protein n=1 Tax=Cohnella lubricantis TaxID=2163172 RepID=A0A841TC03_9BACL|nr:phosphodiester glycosidase family protein [Cohnella lubricantis]MBB6677555.1 phosphodiester glycosidase family protein [Cohnella lubricantis]MBP2116559.1 exopolysaccharide biosynthesis protein [Cohnella lubricantis]
MTLSPIQRLNRTVLLACAPFIGLMIWLSITNFSITLVDSGASQASLPDAPRLSQYSSGTSNGLNDAAVIAGQISQSIKQVSELYVKTNESMDAIMKTAAAQVNRPAQIYDTRITSKLGKQIDSVQSSNLRAQLFAIQAQRFSGYALKVQLKSAEGMKLALGKDKFGGSETTLEAVRRTGAIAGVNAGGFADARGKRYPLSTTVVNGKYVNGFEASYNDLFFVGLNDQLKLIGGRFSSQAQLDKLNPTFGASFVPMLRKNGVNLAIPSKWQTSPNRAPRTVIASYKDNQILFLVIDGRDENGSSGATLEEIQLLLARYGTVDGYNLDGGGSSTLIFKDRIVNHPSDGQLRPLATNFLFFK